jgi:hypothetical protein
MLRESGEFWLSMYVRGKWRVLLSMYVKGKWRVLVVNYVRGKWRVLVVNASGTYSYHFLLSHTHELSLERKYVNCRTKKTTTLGER